ncbi:hypothetical protein ACVITL_005817 [Rhizobium pisi]
MPAIDSPLECAAISMHFIGGGEWKWDFQQPFDHAKLS